MVKQEKIINIPNLFTLFRLLLIPVFIYYLVVVNNRILAAIILSILGTTDWVDGWLARKLDQRTNFGAVFDPTVDRLLFLVAVPAVIYTSSVPLIIAVLAVIREIMAAGISVFTYVHDKKIVKVTWAGKTGAFLLMFGFPLFIAGSSGMKFNETLEMLGWLFSIPGLIYAYYSVFFEYFPKYIFDK